MSNKHLIDNLNPQQRRLHYFEKNYKEILKEIILFNTDNNYSFTQMLYNYANNIEEIPLCICGNKVTFKSYTTGYNRYCTDKCWMLDENLVTNRKLKYETTNINKYGVKYPMQNKDISNKSINAIKQKYGEEYSINSKEFFDKTNKTNIEKYGEKWYFNTEDFKKKSADTCLKLYNETHHTKSASFKETTKQANLDKWGVDCYAKTDEFKAKMQLYYKTEKFTENNYKIKSALTDKYLEYYKNYNRDCELISIENKQLLLKCKICNGDFYISKQLYYLRNKKEAIICTVCNPKNGSNISIDEKKLAKFIGKYTTIIENYEIDKMEIDIYLPELKIGFEYNGLYWHSDVYKDKNYHIDKTLFFKKHDIELYHIWEDNWLYKQEIVKSLILNKIRKLKILNIDDYYVKILDNYTIEHFLIANDIDGYSNTDINLGLYNDDFLVEALSFNKLSDNTYIMAKYASILNFSTPNAFNILFDYFKQNYIFNIIISYSDYATDLNNIQPQLGFKLVELSEPKLITHYKKAINDSNEYKIYNCGTQKWIYHQ